MLVQSQMIRSETQGSKGSGTKWHARYFEFNVAPPNSPFLHPISILLSPLLAMSESSTRTKTTEGRIADFPCPNCNAGPFGRASDLNKHLKKNKCRMKLPQGRRTDLVTPTVPPSESFVDLRGTQCLALWKTVPLWHPLREQGLDCIRRLFAVERPSLAFTTVDILEVFNTTPRWSHLFTDLHESSRKDHLFNGAGQFMDTDLTLALFHESFANSDSPDHAHCIAAMNFKGARRGLLSCGPSQPTSFRSAAWLADVEDAHLHLDSVLTPPGYMTDIHIDEALIGTHVINLIGTKLWITWPRTESNLKILGRRHLRPSSVNLAEHIRMLENPSLAVLNQGSGLYMTPGTIHAVISLTKSGLTGYKLARPEDLPTAQECFDWELRIVYDRLLDNPAAAAAAILDWDRDIQIWTSLNLQQPNPEIERLLTNVHNSIDELKSFIQRPPKTRRR
jgi:hypothetical protein